MSKKRIIAVKVLPGEPTDGTGRVCIHMLVRDSIGPITEPYVLHPKLDGDGNRVGAELEARPTRMVLACDGTRRRTVAPVVRDGVTAVTHRTEDPRATTCPRCIASKYYVEAMRSLGEATAVDAAK